MYEQEKQLEINSMLKAAHYETSFTLTESIDEDIHSIKTGKCSYRGIISY